MKNVLVFGNKGFIGRNLVKEIKENYPFNVCGSDIDIFDVTWQENWVDEYVEDYDYIFYLSAFSDIKHCNACPVSAFAVNVNGLLYLLEKIKEQNTTLIFSSSVYVYNNSSGIYGITKRTAESIIKWYSKNHSLDYRILRYGTVYGIDSLNSMYKLIKTALDTGIISYYGTGEEIREYIHIKDVVNCSLEILNDKYKNKTLTLTGHFPMKAKDMCYILREILGEGYDIKFESQVPSGHYTTTPYSYMPDISEKYVANTFYDLGAGLLSLIKEIEEEN